MVVVHSGCNPSSKVVQLSSLPYLLLREWLATLKPSLCLSYFPTALIVLQAKKKNPRKYRLLLSLCFGTKSLILVMLLKVNVKKK